MGAPTARRRATACCGRCGELEIDGIHTTVPAAQSSLLDHPDFAAGNHSTKWVEDEVDPSVLAAAAPRRTGSRPPTPSRGRPLVERTVPVEVDGKRFAVKVWLPDAPAAAAPARRRRRRRHGRKPRLAPRGGGAGDGTISRADAGHDREGARRASATRSRPGQALLVLEAMKMENHINAETGGTVRRDARARRRHGRHRRRPRRHRVDRRARRRAPLFLRRRVHRTSPVPRQPGRGVPARRRRRDAAWMQAVAAEMNLSETAFVDALGGATAVRPAVVHADGRGRRCAATRRSRARTSLVRDRLLAVAGAARTIRHCAAACSTRTVAGDVIELDFPAPTRSHRRAHAGLAEALGLRAGDGRRRADAPAWSLEARRRVATVRDRAPDFDAVATVRRRSAVT